MLSYRDADSKGPDVWYLKTPHFSLIEENEHLPLRTFAVFNMEDEKRSFDVNISDLNLPDGAYTITNIWTLESYEASGIFSIELAGRCSALYAINPKSSEYQILDANIKIDKVIKKDDSLLSRLNCFRYHMIFLGR